jgi:hypothetical protein
MIAHAGDVLRFALRCTCTDNLIAASAANHSSKSDPGMQPRCPVKSMRCDFDHLLARWRCQIGDAF